MKIKEMKSGDSNLVFHALIVDCKTRQTVNQTPYFGLIISDGEETADARIWTTNIVNELNDSEIKLGNVYKLTAKVQDYAGKIQIIITNIQEPDQGVDSLSFFRTAPISQKKLIEGIGDYLQKINNPILKKMVSTLLNDHFEAFMTFPAATVMHHNYLFGLAYHTYSMLRLADGYLLNYPQLNADLLYSGIIIHDLGKVYELSDAKIPSYTKEGHLLGHIVIILQLLALTANKLDYLKTEEYLCLSHLLAAHHGELEHGSPKEPTMLEAYALYYLDLTDSKLTALSDEVRKTLPGTTTQPIPTINRRTIYVYKDENDN